MGPSRFFEGDSSRNLSKPHLSLCLRVLSRRRTRQGLQALRRLFPDASQSRGPFAWEFPGRLLLRRRLL